MCDNSFIETANDLEQEVFYIRVSKKYASRYCSGGRIWVGEEDIPAYVSKRDRKTFATKEDAKAAIVDHSVEIVVEEKETNDHP